MNRLRRLAVSLAVVATLVLPLGVAAPASAAAARDGDCIILGPNYVEEAVDCAVTILSLLVGGDPIEP